MPHDAITWLHLSDLHGGPPDDAGWAVLDQELRADLLHMAESLGPPDLVLLTGDLARTGEAPEYDQVDRLLERLDRWLGCSLPVVAVPGNHDLVRPRSPWRYVALRDYEAHPTLHRDLWDEGQPLLEPLFPHYGAWAARRVIEPLLQRGYEAHASPRVPGDLSVVFDKGQLRLGVVGLNTAWTHLDDDAEGRLHVLARQLYAALPPDPSGDPLAWFDDLDGALLLTHHPRGYLDARAKRAYKKAIHPPRRFVLALCGHQHEPWGEIASGLGGRPRAFCQAPSLYGMPYHGPGQKDRTWGYAWGRFTKGGQVRVWPRRRIEHDGGFRLEPDLGYQPAKDALGGVVMA
ncbi:MAG: metallophosphoesterase [Myxococcales bacterium]|nr:metallophosphoesterase [Myxococcales bacterium]